MPFEPRTKQEILQSLVASVIAQSPLTDASEGSVAATLMGAVADELERVEYRILGVRESFNLDFAVGEDLNERARDYPAAELERKPIGYASGAVMRLVRSGTTGDLLCPAGMTFAKASDPNIVYRLTVDTTIPNGSSSVDGGQIVCLTGGTAGNAPGGAISIVLDGPGEVVQAYNTAAVTGGRPAETDSSLRSRLRAYQSSLAKAQPIALEYLARSFVDSDGRSVLHAHAFEDAVQPGYTELIVDDGSGMTGYIQAGATVSGTLPVVGGVGIHLYHRHPAVSPITSIRNTTTGVTHVYDPGNPQWVSIEERGLVVLLDNQAIFSPGDGWEISGYNVYTGFIRELQRAIGGDPSDPGSSSGWRASGCRVKVAAPTVSTLDLRLNLIVELGADLVALTTDIEAEVLSYFQGLGPGEPYFESAVTSRLMALGGLQAVEVLSPTSPTVYPLSNRAVLRLGTLELL